MCTHEKKKAGDINDVSRFQETYSSSKFIKDRVVTVM